MKLPRMLLSVPPTNELSAAWNSCTVACTIGSFMSAEAAEKLAAELNEAGITARTGKIGDEEEILQLRSREVK